MTALWVFFGVKQTEMIPEWISKLEPSTQGFVYFVLLYVQPVATETKLFLSAFIYLDLGKMGERKKGCV